MNILIVVTVDNNYSGGHQISAADIGTEFIKNGHTVHYAVNTHSITTKQYHKESIIHHLPYKGKVLGYFSSGLILFRLLRQYQVDCVIAMDKPSAFHASLPAAATRTKFIPIIPGGSSNDINIKPLMVDLVVVFSQENKETLIKKWKFDEKRIKVITGRINSQKFETKPKKDGIFEYKMAFVSRIHEQKRKSFKNFVKQLSILPPDILYQADVIGDGGDLPGWQTEVQNGMNVSFIGHRKIEGNALHKYDLIIGQGRSVIEAIFSGIPAAVCGSEGYKGLVNLTSAKEFERTNFTGREVPPYSDLVADLKKLANIHFEEQNDLRKYIFSKYDVSQLYHNIHEIIITRNLVYNLISIIFLNFKSILSKI